MTSVLHTQGKEGRTQVVKQCEQTWCHYSQSAAVQRSLAVCWPTYFSYQGLSQANQNQLSQENRKCFSFPESCQCVYRSSSPCQPVAQTWVLSGYPLSLVVKTNEEEGSDRNIDQVFYCKAIPPGFLHLCVQVKFNSFKENIIISCTMSLSKN